MQEDNINQMNYLSGINESYKTGVMYTNGTDKLIQCTGYVYQIEIFEENYFGNNFDMDYLAHYHLAHSPKYVGLKQKMAHELSSGKILIEVRTLVGAPDEFLKTHNFKKYE